MNNSEPCIVLLLRLRRLTLLGMQCTTDDSNINHIQQATLPEQRVSGQFFNSQGSKDRTGMSRRQIFAARAGRLLSVRMPPSRWFARAYRSSLCSGRAGIREGHRLIGVRRAPPASKRLHLVLLAAAPRRRVRRPWYMTMLAPDVHDARAADMTGEVVCTAGCLVCDLLQVLSLLLAKRRVFVQRNAETPEWDEGDPDGGDLSALSVLVRRIGSQRLGNGKTCALVRSRRSCSLHQRCSLCVSDARTLELENN